MVCLSIRLDSLVELNELDCLFKIVICGIMGSNGIVRVTVDLRLAPVGLRLLWDGVGGMLPVVEWLEALLSNLLCDLGWGLLRESLRSIPNDKVGVKVLQHRFGRGLELTAEILLLEAHSTGINASHECVGDRRMSCFKLVRYPCMLVPVH